ncbi:hypothetical protein GCM10011512_17160 [Tersicoccus solisilvae]|uniref:HTH marR-type domain-containing protein n=1 Tax=Tersicoccus solisilvae TaxID=1882339 RepID=A0ABQ1P4N2_9MICC|nr:MarR family transcriptional regulator [Tersicoccus solisilvae]GGC90706.1 hypothetical protein GCM10011512_17160 [Tersicoccus solisilvae]
MQRHSGGSSGYWYGPPAATSAASPDARPRPAEPAAEDEPAVRVLNALRDYRAAEAGMRRRSRDAMGMGEKDLLALRYLLEADRAGTLLTPGDLARRLGISTASTTTLLDRLTRSGHVRRAPHPTDRRALVVLPTADTDGEVRSTLGGMHERMLDVARSLDPEQAETVAAFLTAMAAQVAAPLDGADDAVESRLAPPAPGGPRPPDQPAAES